jgi:two-component system, NtrC family, response regulator AtoC
MAYARGSAVVVGDDSIDDRSYLETLLQSQGYNVRLAEDGDEVLDAVAEESPALILLDLGLPRLGGLETLDEIRKMYNGVPVIMMSGFRAPGHIRETIESQKALYLEKPILPEHLTGAMGELLGNDKPKLPKPVAAPKPTKPSMLNSFMRQIDHLITQVGNSEVPVLLQGETGVGKEVLAREIHMRSPRAKKPFVKVNCAALPTELVESELFGYERGAFTGAFKDRPGRFEIAREGTVLLDEIGDMDVSLQAKLLQVLQDGEFHRLGSRELVKVDVRVMAATHQDLRKAIVEGRFREDLYYRLNVINIKIPSLRERKSEIISLAEYFLSKHATPDFPVPPIPDFLKDAMLAYQWPGNIRELENTMRRYLVVRSPEHLCEEFQHSSRSHLMPVAAPVASVTTAPAPLPVAAVAPPPVEPIGDLGDDSPLRKVELTKQAAERQTVLEALNATRWNRKKAASLLNIDYKALLYKMKKLGLAAQEPASPIPAGREERASYDSQSEAQ